MRINHDGVKQASDHWDSELVGYNQHVQFHAEHSECGGCLTGCVCSLLMRATIFIVHVVVSRDHMLVLVP